MAEEAEVEDMEIAVAITIVVQEEVEEEHAMPFKRVSVIVAHLADFPMKAEEEDAVVEAEVVDEVEEVMVIAMVDEAVEEVEEHVLPSKRDNVIVDRHVDSLIKSSNIINCGVK